ncbi:tyrosine-protein phosphatase [Nocardioides immobilis]|uniref:Tyrosine-protein phosphatase n=1 Tax=Nocardioides immobilis TaxID=2049295 RepID=A0A417XTE3_9ACTN|nr:tyrosine-protein phosphatase [Nocardioides immobilis]
MVDLKGSSEQGSDPTAPGVHQRPVQDRRREEGSPVSTSNAERWVDLAEVDNVRDLGGLPLSDGGCTRRGVVFRASTLQEATEADVAQLVGIRRLRTIVDLRLPAEAAREGHGLLGTQDVEVVNLPVRKGESTLLDVVVPDSRTTDLGLLYQQLLVGSAPSIVTAARLIGDPARHGVVFHCAAGKDRTGVLAAVLLDAVGVLAEAIIDDYVMTAERQHRVRERLVRIPAYRNLPAVAQGVMAVDGVGFARFVEWLQADAGGGARFLLDHGLTGDELALLRTALRDEPGV